MLEEKCVASIENWESLFVNRAASPQDRCIQAWNRMVILCEHSLHPADEFVRVADNLWCHQEIPIDHVSDFHGELGEKWTFSNRISTVGRHCRDRTSGPWC